MLLGEWEDRWGLKTSRTACRLPSWCQSVYRWTSGITPETTDSSVRQLNKQNMCHFTLFSIHVTYRNRRMDLERSQGEKVQNPKELPGQIYALHLKTQLIVSCDSSDNQIYFGCDWKHIGRLTQYVSKYVSCQGRSTALIMRWKLNFKQEISRNILYIQVSLSRNCHRLANMPQIVMEGHIRQKRQTKTWLIHLILLI